ncbi:hypothetical protein ACAW74_26370 [Fibrella sp. WM1]|uniref:hypothetical protein n=1 Tax=Fibrella musci TaxID=3242485 RepID=UPI003520D280
MRFGNDDQPAVSGTYRRHPAGTETTTRQVLTANKQVAEKRHPGGSTPLPKIQQETRRV